MALWAGSIATLAEFSDFLGGASIAGAEDRAEQCVHSASRALEAFLGRRVIYRAPVESAVSVVAEVAITNATLTLVGPLAGARTLVVEVTDPSRSMGAGTLTITGTVGGVSTVRTVDLGFAGKTHVPDFFTAIASCVVTGASVTSATTKIRIGTSLGYVEYHSADGRQPETLRLLEAPISAVASCYDDTSSPRTYSSDSLLTAGTDFDTSPNDGELTRLTSGEPDCWSAYRRGVKVTYSTAWTRTTVPSDIKRACLKLAALMWGEQTSRTIGIQSMSNEAGNWTRFAPAEVKGDIAGLVDVFRRVAWWAPTGERIFDLEDC